MDSVVESGTRYLSQFMQKSENLGRIWVPLWQGNYWTRLSGQTVSLNFAGMSQSMLYVQYRLLWRMYLWYDQNHQQTSLIVGSEIE